jgi:hypothetical protein
MGELLDLIEETISLYDSLDCVFTAVGVKGEILPGVMGMEERWDQILEVNLNGI